MLRKLLIANRGEIALRIIRTAQVMGLETVAVYSEADARSPHVFAADEAVLIGGAEAAFSYLNTNAIIAAAKTTGADSIHPGYGFLSERPDFAEAVDAAGLTFVGPPASVMRAVGDKIAARKLAKEAGVPVVPGIETAEIAEARSFAAKAGYPVLVKAAAGGGGRGMRVVAAEKDLAPSLEAAAREAKAAFGDGTLFVEKLMARPRHIEVQILCDNHGGAVALGERECSIQRRHQKIIEESPAPGINASLRDRMVDAALKLAQVANYRNAGTVEFLLSGDSDFYFLEVNSRLQVEHPITEIRFNCDLVAEQLKLAAGEKVLKPCAPWGHAIECRIYAEDAAHDFRPTAGKVLYLNLPSGPGVRFDTFLTVGSEVVTFYDGMLGKLICYGADRSQARSRMINALEQFCLAGLIHTAAFLRDVVASDAFARGDLSTSFLGDYFPRWSIDEHTQRAALLAALIGGEGSGGRRRTTATDHAQHSKSPWQALGDFRLGLRR
jgi:acetyl/propionyl-CoA carboxylase alpha subunit